MSWTKTKQSTRTLIFAVAVVSLAALGLWIGVQHNQAEANTTVASNNTVPAATFAADPTTLGAIPDGGTSTPCAVPGTPRNVNFNVSGLSGVPSNVELSMTFGGPAHTWRGDLVVSLIAPTGASHTIFARTGANSATAFGSSSDLTGPYNFKDSATGTNWWAVAATPTTPGDYRTTAAGPQATTTNSPVTNMTQAFASVSNPNGTWTMRIVDCTAGDVGSIAAASLTIDAGSTPPPTTNDANVDLNGDGKTDWVVARGTSNPLAESAASSEFGVRRNFDSSVESKSKTRENREAKAENLMAPPIYWYSSINGTGVTGVGQLGDAATDFLTPEDFDGDGRDDLAVWTEAPATQANFKILQSSTNTIRVELFGQTGDDPAVVGDYDGDGKADPAVYRCPPFDAADGQCFFFYRGSANNPGGTVTYVPWGFGVDGDFFPYVGDFDGDAKNDFCIQRANPSSPSNGQFILLKSNGLGIEYINWGLSSDFLIPGDYDGDGKTDLCVRRTQAGQRNHYILTRTGATGQVVWGVTGDVSTPGDYDGDGKTDLAIWRGSVDPNANFFWVLNSSNNSVTQFEWGQCPTAQTCDFPVAAWAVH